MKAGARRRSKTLPPDFIVLIHANATPLGGTFETRLRDSPKQVQDVEAPDEIFTACIFDWDDTLLPTWFIYEVLYPCLGPDRSMCPVEADCPFYEALADHARKVRAVLTSAAAVSRVGIVTLAVRPWVTNSANWFLPGLDTDQLLKDLRIPVLYAREELSPRIAALAQQIEGADVFMLAKAKAMSKCLRMLGHGRKSCNKRHAISIGDSPQEKEALQALLWDYDARQQSEPWCKTVKLMEDPTLAHLGMELQLVEAWIGRMTRHDGDFDICMDGTGLDFAEQHFAEEAKHDEAGQNRSLRMASYSTEVGSQDELPNSLVKNVPSTLDRARSDSPRSRSMCW